MLVLLIAFQTLIRLAKCWLSVRHTDGVGWYFKSRLTSALKTIDTPEKIRVSLVLDWPQSRQKNPNFPFKHSKLLSVLIDTIIMINLFSRMEYFV